LIIEDETRKLAEFMSRVILEQAVKHHHLGSWGTIAVNYIKNNKVDINILLDLMLPGLGGPLKSANRCVPIQRCSYHYVTAKQKEIDRLIGLRNGAQMNYVCKAVQPTRNCSACEKLIYAVLN